MIKAKDKQIIINMATSWLPIIVGIVVFFFLTPYMRLKLGDDMLGIWYLISGLQIYLALGHSSTKTSLTKYVAEYRATNDTEKLNTVISTGFAQYGLFILAICISAPVIVILAKLLPAMNTPGQFQTTRLTLILLIVNFVINTPVTGIQAVIAGFHRYDLNNTAATLRILLHAVGTFLLLLSGYGIVQLAIWQIIITIIIGAILLIGLKQLHPNLLARKFIRWQTMKQLLRFNIHTFIIAVASLLFYHADNIVIGAMYAGSAITYYALGYKIITQIQQIANPAMNVLLPVASEISTLEPDQRRQKLHELFIRGSRFSAIIVTPICIFLIVLGLQFIQLWQGPQYTHSESSYQVLMMIMLPFYICICQHIGTTMLYGLAVHHIMTVQWVVVSVANLVLSIIFGRMWGILGVAFGTALPLLINQMIMQYHYRSAFDISLPHYYRLAWAKLIPPTALSIIILMIVKYKITFTHFYQILVVAVIICLTFWVLSWRAIDSYEKQILRHLIVRCLGRRTDT